MASLKIQGRDLEPLLKGIDENQWPESIEFDLSNENESGISIYIENTALLYIKNDDMLVTSEGIIHSFNGTIDFNQFETIFKFDGGMDAMSDAINENRDDKFVQRLIQESGNDDGMLSLDQLSNLSQYVVNSYKETYNIKYLYSVDSLIEAIKNQETQLFIDDYKEFKIGEEEMTVEIPESKALSNSVNKTFNSMLSKTSEVANCEQIRDLTCNYIKINY